MMGQSPMNEAENIDIGFWTSTTRTQRMDIHVSQTRHLRDAEGQVEGNAELFRGQSAIAIVVSHGEQRVQQIGVNVGLAEDLHRRGVVNDTVGVYTQQTVGS
jgi:hypothetical protein